ncbi:MULTISPECIES: hypothetical protein [unclassified Acinetobacter]|uniref:hypothetical protein n=1 Tax=unclassified Acinetobacter TaxID=196816 RepID=UPI001FD6ADF4|nr:MULTISPECIES: hypothetical protein [unclassified Acinetobacter]
MSENRMILIHESELESMLDRVCKKAILEAFAEKDDELLNITQLCERIPGLTWYTFKKLAKNKKLPNVQGKYSLKLVKAAMQSR